MPKVDSGCVKASRKRGDDMKKQGNRKLHLGREVVKQLAELHEGKLREVVGGLRGCTNEDSGCSNIPTLRCGGSI